MRLSHPSVYYRLSADQTIEIDCADHSLCAFISFFRITALVSDQFEKRAIPKRFTRENRRDVLAERFSLSIIRNKNLRSSAERHIAYCRS
jgi:hypothetical protein